MALSLRHFYNQTAEKYHLSLVTPTEALDQTITWIYMIEDVNNCSFIRGGELVITTGLIATDEDALLTLAIKCKQNGASGIGFFLGRYVNTLPKSIIKWCSDHDFPAFIIPWEVRLSDLTHYYCQKIVSEQQEQGLRGSKLYSALTGDLTEKDGDIFPDFTNGQLFASFVPLQVTSFAQTLFDGVYYYLCRTRIVPASSEPLGVSNPIGNRRDWSFISLQAKHALIVAQIKSKTLVHYSEIGFYRAALSVENINVLKAAKERLSALSDETTRLVLRTYLENNRSVKRTADLLFLHRNTINYHVGKAHRLLELDERSNDLEILFDFYLCDCLSYYLED